MKKKYLTPVMEVYKYMPEACLLVISTRDGSSTDMSVRYGYSDDEEDSFWTY